MKKVIILLSAIVFFTGCASKEKILEVSLNKCPPLRKYSNETLLKAAESLKKLVNDDELEMLVNDYGKLREACRVAEQKLKSIKRK